MVMLALEGAHGTTACRAFKIIEDGFRLGGMCFWGLGVYFFPRQPEGKQLAINWYNRNLDCGEYNGDEDDSCAVVYAEISVDEENYFNLLDHNVLDLYYEHEDDMRAKKYTTDEKNFARDQWLRAFEALYKEEIKVFLGSIPVPKKYFRPLTKTDCIVVKDVNCITQPCETEICYE